jgi:hypothetical protein
VSKDKAKLQCSKPWPNLPSVSCRIRRLGHMTRKSIWINRGYSASICQQKPEATFQMIKEAAEFRQQVLAETYLKQHWAIIMGFQGARAGSPFVYLPPPWCVQVVPPCRSLLLHLAFSCSLLILLLPFAPSPLSRRSLTCPIKAALLLFPNRNGSW